MDIKRPELKIRRLRKRLLLGALGALVLITAVAAVWSLDPALPSVARSSAWIDVVERGKFVREVRGPGRLVPREIRWIAAASSGRVERVLARPGVRVEPDTVLVELSSPELLQLRDEAQARLAAARADLASLAAELDRALLDARATLVGFEGDLESQRMQAEAERKLNERGIVSTIQYRQTRLGVEQLEMRIAFEQQRIERLSASHEARLDAESARVDQARRLLERREQQVADLRIRAGLAGVLQEVAVEPGQRVDPGSSIARVARPDELIAELQISETQAREIQLDQQVRIDTRNGLVSGRVMRIDPAVRSGSVQVDVELNGDLPAGARPDLSVDGIIELERLEDVLHVGRPASGQPEARTSVFRMLDDSVAERVGVTLGRASVGRIEIVSGLEPGDRVILSDMSRWSEHDRVRLE